MSEPTLPDHVFCDVIPANQGAFSTIDAVLVSNTLLVTHREIPLPIDQARIRFRDGLVHQFSAQKAGSRIGGSYQNLINVYSVQVN